MKLLDFISAATAAYVEKMPKESRKQYGQFFTSKETARFMAAMFELPEGVEELSVLDPGTGTGILSAALLDRLETIPTLQTIRLVCYENDENVLPLLRENLGWMAAHCSKKVHWELIAQNYITSQREAYNALPGAQPVPEQFDLVIANPPYKKVARTAPEALAMEDVCYGAPNLYFLFAAMSLFNAKDGGQLVYITPRSWTSGAYFEYFRRKLVEESALEQIHLFTSRDKVFEKESVLQETMIFRARKTRGRPACVQISTTQGNADFSSRTQMQIPYEALVCGKENYVFLTTSSKEAQVLERLNRWPDRLPDLGLKMKTGVTVDFRNREALRSQKEEGAVPLFYAQHIQEGKVLFPIGKENEYLVTQQKGLLQQNANYLFVKRFTAKEEHRRLQCGVYLARKNPQYTKISTQNKINFIGGLQELSECVVYGLYVLFNSTIYDCYYRVLNGSTQVNSTEVNAMPVPPMPIIEAMGKELLKKHDLSEQACDQILESYL